MWFIGKNSTKILHKPFIVTFRLLRAVPRAGSDMGACMPIWMLLFVPVLEERKLLKLNVILQKVYSQKQREKPG